MKNLIILAFLLLPLSCFKQDAPEVTSDRDRTTRDRDQLKACSDITFYEGFLKHKNITNLFVCTSWDRKFVEMYSALKQINETDWNTILNPIDDIFFADRERRDRFITYYRELDKDDALDDLGRVLTALTDTNFYDGLNKLFKCSENPSDEDCLSRSITPTKAEIKNFFDILNRNPKILMELSLVIDNFNNASRDDSEELRKEINKFNDTDFFKSLRVMLVSKMAEKYISGLDSTDLKMIKRLFLTQANNGKSWIKSWLDDESVTYEYLLETLSVPVVKQKQMVRDFKVLNGLYVNEIRCDSNEIDFNLDIKSLVNETMTLLEVGEKERFFEKLLLSVEATKYAQKICPNVTSAKGVVNYYEYSQRRNVNHTLELSNTITYLMGILSHNQSLELSKYIINITDSNYDYLVSLLGGEIFNVGNEVNRVVIENAAPFYDVILRILKKSDDQMYKSMAVLANELISESKSPDIYAWSKVWLFWSTQERNFLFNFIDRHLDDDTDYIRLFEFYSLFLKEMSSNWLVLRDAYIKDEHQKEQTYQAFKNFSKVFHGDKILSDYKKFFSRDHIVELLRVITSGESFVDDQISSLSVTYESDFYSLPRVDYSLSMSGFDGSESYECAKEISKLGDLQSVILNYPKKCESVQSSYALKTITMGINDFITEYLDNYPSREVDHFFKNGGVLSPSMIEWSLASAVELRTNYEASGKSLSDLFSFFDKYLLSIGEEKTKGKDILNQVISLSEYWLGSNDDISFRNTLLRKLTSNQSRVEVVQNKLPGLFLDYSNWLRNYKESSYVEDSNYSCEKFINTGVGANVCPEKSVIKKNLSLLTSQLIKKHEDKEGRAIDYILEAAVYGDGIDIPLDAEKTEKKRLTLVDTFNYLYDLSDKSLAVNNVLVKHRPRLNADKEKYKLTTSERIDLVIRNVAFDYNYLGVQYLNAIVKGDDYTDIVKDKQKLMSLCVNAPVVRCGKKMSKDEKRMARNALWAYDGLVDVNNGNGLEPKLVYGKYMQTFLLSMVGSSSKEAQEVTFWPLDKDLLLKHNGRALGYFSEMASFSNMGRVVHDRVGRSREEFVEFINKDQFKRVNDYLFANANIKDLKDVFNETFEILNRDNDGATLIDTSVDWLESLSYQEMRLLEELVSKVLYLSTYLGSEEFVFGQGDSKEFKEHSVYELLSISTKFLRKHVLISKQLGEEDYLRNMISPANTIVSFFYDMLSAEKTRRDYWEILNITYAGIKTSLYELGGDDLIVRNIVEKTRVNAVSRFVKGSNKYLNRLDNDSFEEIAEHLRIINQGAVKNEMVWDFLKKTTVSATCPLEEGECVSNPTYDDFYKMMFLFTKKSNLDDFIDWLILDNRNSFLKTANEFFPHIRIR
ncbi:hypothetical protein [Halobacteriovorax sp. HLS]|uniref:hypothetical protein n=1 Tax=Halobacteriovorax sp. HLS TaxID=2234000 RepID=UPI000FD8CD3E|nr:hypothetical protein [Halobacteriovorax sp. HLS]